MEKIINFLNGLGKEFFLIIIYYLLILLLSLVFHDSLNLNSPNYEISNILINLLLIIIFLIIFRKKIIAKLDDYKNNGKSYLKKSFIYYIVGLIVMVVSLNIITFFYQMPLNETANRETLMAFPLSSLFNILITAPLVEELLTRVILKDYIKNKYLYIFISGLLFAFLHILTSLSNGITYELLFLISYGAIGIAFSLMYYKTDNIWTSITYHFIHNLICLILIFGGLA